MVNGWWSFAKLGYLKADDLSFCALRSICLLPLLSRPSGRQAGRGVIQHQLCQSLLVRLNESVNESEKERMRDGLGSHTVCDREEIRHRPWSAFLSSFCCPPSNAHLEDTCALLTRCTSRCSTLILSWPIGVSVSEHCQDLTCLSASVCQCRPPFENHFQMVVLPAWLYLSVAAAVLSRRAHEAPPSIRGRHCATICRRTLSSSTGWLVSVGVRSLLFLGRHHTSYVQQQQQPRDRQFLQVIGVMHPPEWWCVLGMTQRREKRERETVQRGPSPLRRNRTSINDLHWPRQDAINNGLTSQTWNLPSPKRRHAASKERKKEKQ